MQLNLSLIQDRINLGIKESVESLQDYPLELRFDHSRGVLTEFLKDDSYTREKFTLMNFDDRDNFRVADHLIYRRGKVRGLYIVGRSDDSSKSTGFFLRLNKISAAEIECIVEEKISLSSDFRNLVLYNDGHRVQLEDFSYHELIDLLIKIRQCTPKTLLESMFPIMLHFDMMKFNKICDVSGRIKDEYQDENIYELIEETMSRDEFERCMFTPKMLIDSDVPQITRGWTKSYKFKIDISDTTASLNEDQKRVIPAIESRIREALIENTPKCIETRVINNLDLTEIAENIAINDPRYSTNVFTEIEDHDGDLEKIALAIIEEENHGDVIFYSSYGARQWIYLRKFFESDNQSSRYTFNLRYASTAGGGLHDPILHKDGHLMYLDDAIKDIMAENGLSGDYTYRKISEDLFFEYGSKFLHVYEELIELDIDFSDLFE